MRLRYGMNPHQQPATADPIGQDPIAVLHGEPSYVNLLDALNAWQLVREAAAVLDVPAATSFKHVSPAGAAIAGEIDAVIATTYRVDQPGPLASAYLRARDADPRSSYGDFVAVSEPVDEELTAVLTKVASDGIIAPGYAPGTAARLGAKKNGRYLVIEVDPAFEPPADEHRDVFGLRLHQPRDNRVPDADDLKPLPEPAVRDALLGLIALRYTQSNSVAYVRDGMTLGIGAGQQSRIDCTRLAGAKTDTWWLRRHPDIQAMRFDRGTRINDRINTQIERIQHEPPDAGWLARLDGVTFVSDGSIPFRDNIDEASRHGVRFMAEPGAALRSADVLAACEEHGIMLAHTGIRLFHH